MLVIKEIIELVVLKFKLIFIIYKEEKSRKKEKGREKVNEFIELYSLVRDFFGSFVIWRVILMVL